MSDSIRYLLADIDEHLGERIAVAAESMIGAPSQRMASMARQLNDLQALRARVRDALADMREQA